MRALSFEPLLPPALWLTLAALLIALLAWYAARRPSRIPRSRWAGALLLSALAAGVVLLVLLNPTWNEEEPPPAGKPQLTILLDASASMATPDADAGATRFQAAAAPAQQMIENLSGAFDVRLWTFDTQPAPAGITELAGREAAGALTDVAGALRAALDRDQPAGAAVALLSDGIHNAGDRQDVLEAARLAKALAAPVYTLTFGGAQDVRDVAVEFTSAQELAAAGQKVPVRVIVRQRGLAGAVARVVLRHGPAEVGRAEVALADAATEARFDVQQAAVGLYRYEAEVQPFPEEVTRVNNTATFVLRAVDQPIRVLVLEGKPYWDTKFFLRTLAADPLIELHSLVRLTDNRVMQRTLPRAMPAGATAASAPAATGAAARTEDWRIIADPNAALGADGLLRDTQVVVLGRSAELFLSEAVLARLRAWVARDGGALVCYRGAPVTQVNQQLARLLPVQWAPARETRMHAKLTERGRDLRWFGAAGAAVPSHAGDARADGQPPGTAPAAARPGGAGATAEAADVLRLMPTLASVTHVERAKPLAVVLVAADRPGAEDAPMVTYQPYGAGRVVVIEGAGMWRWAFLAPQYEVHDDIYRGLWHSLLRWLVSNAGLLPGQTVSLRSDKVSFSTAESASATLLLREPAGAELPAIELVSEAPEAAADEPRMFTPAPLGDEPGAFRIVFGRLPEGRYHVRVVDSPGPPGTQAASAPGAPDVARQATFDVRSFLEEKLDLKARPDLMARIAAESGGAALDEAAGSPADELAQLYREHAVRSRPPRIHCLSAWDRWWLLLSVFAFWTGAWALRRSGGLV
ncbi:MAG: hypothetical protein AB1716_10730 [Planctomycetota bacterium]